MPEKDQEKKKMANIICGVLNKTKCKNCDYRCFAYETAEALKNAGCGFTQKLIIKRKEK